VAMTPGLSVFYTVVIDAEYDLGAWASISGLGMQIATESRKDSAMSFFEHHLPAAVSYPHITLSRPINADSANVLNWMSTYHMLPIPTVGEINCVDQTGAVIVTWQMMGVSPVSWKGPSLDADKLNAPTETLEIAHMGFL
jgi:phage tail-like protein